MRSILLALTLILTPLASAFAEEPPSQAELTARAEAGDSDAMMELAVMLLDQQDATGAQTWARRAAEAGAPEAMNMMAVLLRASDSAADQAEAERWAERAFAAGSQGARINRAGQLIYEDASEEAWSEGFALLASFDHPQAADTITNFALQYARSANSTQPRVRELLRLAAERGSLAGQWEYAMMLRQGAGGPADLTLAYEWASRSAAGGYIPGIISTAVMLATGEGVIENDVEARAWYQRAVERSSAHALRALGYMLITGEGGPADEPRGWAYMLLAAEGGDQTAINVMTQYGRSIPAQTMQAASAIRAEWLRTHEPPR